MPSNWIMTVHGHKTPAKALNLTALAARLPALRTAPRVIQILAENLARNDIANAEDAINSLLNRDGEIKFKPHRVVMQDASGLPAILDIAGLRDRAAELGLSPNSLDLACKTHLIVDHSIRTAATGRGAAAVNLDLEYRENSERFAFLRWAAQAFRNLSVIPPGNGIIHQINLENLAEVITESDGWVYPDTVIGTDSHTPMVNGLGVLGWGLGGIEATAVMLGQPIYLPPPEIVGIRLINSPQPGVLMTDVVLRLTECLRAEKVVGTFLEFFGPSIVALSVPDRATISNMTPEFGATCSLFPIDLQTIAYLRQTGRHAQAALTLRYLQQQPLLADSETLREFDRIVDFDLSVVRATVAGPSLPHQARTLSEVATIVPPLRTDSDIQNGDVVIAAITSCTNTSNPAAMVTAGLVARNAQRHDLKLSPSIKASFSPGSQAVPHYLNALGLLAPLEDIGFAIAGFGCMTCVGNSGDLTAPIVKAITDHNLNVAAVLSGNRNFEGRIHPLVQSNFLASPPLVIAYALAGTMSIDLHSDAISTVEGKSIYLRDLWPDQIEIDEAVKNIPAGSFQRAHDIDTRWDSVPQITGSRFRWSEGSGYLVRPVIDSVAPATAVLMSARPLAILGDSITTDHISPVGRITIDSPAGQHLIRLGIAPANFNTYGGRRGNAVVMRIGTFANPRLKNLLADREGWFTRYIPSGEVTTIADAADRYAADRTALVIIAGQNYGTGSARDWAAKGTAALGVRAVLARSFERIHRTNLAMLGVLPLEWNNRPNLVGDETFDIAVVPETVTPRAMLPLKVSRNGQLIETFEVRCRLDTVAEVACWRQGGFLAGHLQQLLA